MLEVLKQASENVFVPLTVGGGIRGFTDAEGKTYSALEVASEYFRSGADKVSIGGDAVEAAEEYMRNNNAPTGNSCIEQISKVYGAQVRYHHKQYYDIILSSPSFRFVPLDATERLTRTNRDSLAGRRDIGGSASRVGRRPRRDLACHRQE